jgi:GT2 family glycosyltransferase
MQNRTPGNCDLSIIIVSWNTKKLLLDCLTSLQPCSTNRNIEIIVVDNASSDGSPEAVAKEFPNVRLILNDANLGFSMANNIGIRQCRGRFVCLMNSDVKVLDNCVEMLIDYLDKHPRIGLLGPKIFFPDMTVQSSCRRYPSLWNNFCGFFWLNRLFPKIPFFAAEHMFYFAYDSVKRVDVLVGCFVVARREAIEEVGLLDEDFFFYGEDLDWSKRFRDKGWEIVFYPDAHAIHYARSSSAKAPVRFAIEQQKSVLLYWKKHHSAFSIIVFSLMNIIRHSIRILGSSASYILYPSRRIRTGKEIRGSAGSIKFLLWKGFYL